MYNLKFPREVCSPRRQTVSNEKQFFKFINANIGVCDLYTNVYNFSEFTSEYMFPKYDSAIIDRIYLDCDQKIRENGTEMKLPAYENMLKIHKWCMERDIIHFPRCTGTGYDVIIAVNQNIFIKNKKICVENAQRWLCKELDIKTDPQVIGDIARIHRIDNTFNHKPKTKRFCIPLDKDIIDTGEENIFKVANKQRFTSNWYGTQYWDIGDFDVEKSIYNDVLPINQIEINEEDFSELSNQTPICIKNLLSRKDLNWKERRIVITYLRDNCYALDEAIAVLHKFLSHKKYVHCLKDERQPQHLYRNEKYMFSTQDTLINMGVCPYSLGTKCKDAKKGCMLYGR